MTKLIILNFTIPKSILLSLIHFLIMSAEKWGIFFKYSFKTRCFDRIHCVKTEKWKLA